MLRYLILVFLYCTVYFLTEHILITDDIVYNSFIDRLSYDRISEILVRGKKWKWLSYVFLPVLLFIKILFVVICFSIGGLFLKIDIGFKKFFSLVITAEFIFLILGILTLQQDQSDNTNTFLLPIKIFSQKHSIYGG
jgi:hypothetical protein